MILENCQKLIEGNVESFADCAMAQNFAASFLGGLSGVFFIFGVFLYLL